EGTKMVEAAGIEPASRDAPTRASTCIGRRLVSPAALRRPGSQPASPVFLDATVPGGQSRPACCVAPRPPADKGTSAWLPFVRQPERAGWHLSFSEVIYEGLGPRHATLAVTASGRYRSPPRQSGTGALIGDRALDRKP